MGSLHDVPTRQPARGDRPVGTELFQVPGRLQVEEALAVSEDAGRWPGSYGERPRAALARHSAELEDAFREHDRLVAAAGPQTGRLVLTHGEPHPGNLLRTPGGLVLVDWDTALLAPPERDLWLVDARTRGRATTEYADRTGRRLLPELLARYRLGWALADVAVFVGPFRHSPEETDDTAWSWDALLQTLEGVSRRPSR